MPIKSRCCNPFCCFSACAQTAPSESDPGVSHDVADVSGVPGCDKAPSSGSSNVSLKSEGENVDARLNVEKRPTTSAGAAPSESGPFSQAPPGASHDEASTSGVVDVNLDDLMNHISELLKLREEGKQQQASNIRKFPWPNGPGLQKLKEIVSFGTDLQKLQNIVSSALAVGSELNAIGNDCQDNDYDDDPNYVQHISGDDEDEDEDDGGDGEDDDDSCGVGDDVDQTNEDGQDDHEDDLGGGS